MISQFDDLVWNATDSYPAPLNMSRDQWFALINSIIQKESTFNPNAVSYTGAGIGLMQVNPAIWLTFYNVTREQLFDPWTNIQIGVQIARDYIRKYGTTAGLGAYFAGPLNRLSYSAQAYAKTVLGIYSTLIGKLRSMFSVAAPKPGEFYFLPTAQGPNEYIDIDVLPEQGEGGDWDMPEPYSNIMVETDQSWIWMVGLGFAILWINRN
jgi:hypothetical protein